MQSRVQISSPLPIYIMKLKEKKPEIVFRIINQKGEAVGSPSNEYDFESVEQARTANVHGIYKDTKKYKIAKYKVTYELIKDDC